MTDPKLDTVYLHCQCMVYIINLIFTLVPCNLVLSKFYLFITLVSCLKNNIKIYIKIYIKTAPTCFGAVAQSSGSALIRAH